MISPSGKLIVYRRMGFDKIEDKSIGNLWIINSNGTAHQKLTSFDGDESSPVWSPNGDRIAFVRKTNYGPEIYVYWLNNTKTAKINTADHGRRREFGQRVRAAAAHVLGLKAVCELHGFDRETDSTTMLLGTAYRVVSGVLPSLLAWLTSAPLPISSVATSARPSISSGWSRSTVSPCPSCPSALAPHADTRPSVCQHSEW